MVGRKEAGEGAAPAKKKKKAKKVASTRGKSVGDTIGDTKGHAVGKATGDRSGERVGDHVGCAIGVPRTEAQKAYGAVRVHCIGIGCEMNCRQGNTAARFRTHLLESPACVTEIERVLSSLDAMGEKRKESPMIIWMKRRKWLPEGSPHHVSSTKKK